MRYIKVPAPVVLDHLINNQTKKHPEMPFSEFIRKVLIAHPSITQEDANVTHFMELAETVKDLKTGDIWELEKDQYEYLKTITTGFNYPTESKLALLPHIKAITSAPITKPEPATTPDGKPKPAEETKSDA